MFELPDLPYKEIEGFLSKKQLQFHHGKHHKKYVDTLNSYIELMPSYFEDKTLEEVLIMTWDDGEQSLYNNAGQHYNHSLFWRSIIPGGSKSELIDNELEVQFGSVDNFKTAFKDRALSLFGSGWVWLVSNKGKLSIQTTSNADTPMQYYDPELKPLLVLDVWEHSYYIDYQNDRGKYIDQFFKNIDWSFVEVRYGQ